VARDQLIGDLVQVGPDVGGLGSNGKRAVARSQDQARLPAGGQCTPSVFGRSGTGRRDVWRDRLVGGEPTIRSVGDDALPGNRPEGLAVDRDRDLVGLE
jgi:hypothetical protein